MRRLASRRRRPARTLTPRSGPSGSRSGSATGSPSTASTSSCPGERSTASSGPTARARRRPSGCCSAWSSPRRAPGRCSGTRCRRRRGEALPTGRCARRGTGVPPVPLRSVATWRGSTPPTAGATRAPRGDASTRRSTASGCSPRRPSATAPTRSGCGSGWPSPRALLAPRELLVLDEPTNGLDPQGTREVRHLVESLAARRRHRARLEPPAVGGGADLHPPRRHERRSPRRAGHRRGSCGARARRPCGSRPRQPARPRRC